MNIFISPKSTALIKKLLYCNRILQSINQLFLHRPPLSTEYGEIFLVTWLLHSEIDYLLAQDFPPTTDTFKAVWTRRMAIANGTCVSFCNQPIQVRYRKGPLSQKSAHAEQYAQTKTNTNPSPDPNRYRRRCPDPNARIQKFIHYMAIAVICDSGPLW